MKNEDRREKKMKNFILVFVMFIMTGVVYGQSSVYINQSGGGLDLDITLDGDGSSVGASNDITQIEGENLDIVIDLDASSTVTGDVYITGDGASVDELNLTSQGNGVAYTLAIGASGDLSVGTSVIETRTNANSGSTNGGTSMKVLFLLFQNLSHLEEPLEKLFQHQHQYKPYISLSSYQFLLHF